MAEYGPAIFQVFADSVRATSHSSKRMVGVFNPMSEEELITQYGFGSGVFDKSEDFKNNIFRVIMLRARNELMQRIVDHPGGITSTDLDVPSVTVKLEVVLSNSTIHPGELMAAPDDVIKYAVKGSEAQDSVKFNGKAIKETQIGSYATVLGCGSTIAAVEASLGKLRDFKWKGAVGYKLDHSLLEWNEKYQNYTVKEECKKKEDGKEED